jgi:hypothetical protein
MKNLINLTFATMLVLYSKAFAGYQLDPSLKFLAHKGVEISKINSTGDLPKIYHIQFLFEKILFNVDVILPITAENARPIVNNSLFILLKSFEATPTPYVGQITKVQECNTISKPKITNVKAKDLQIKLISFLSDTTLRPGLCVPKKQSVEVCQSFFYIPKLSSLVKIKSNSSADQKCLKLTSKFLEELNY